MHVNGYEKRTQVKRAAILKAAQELFAQKGVAPVSVTEIADRAKVSRVTLFKYFGDKETLAKEAMQAWVEALIGEYRDIVSSGKPFQEKLLTLLTIRKTSRDRIGEQFIASTAWDDHEMKRLIYDMAKTSAFPLVRDFLREGRESGFIDSSLDEEAIFTYISVIAPVIQNPEIIKKSASFHTSLFDLFMGGLIKNWYEIKTDF